MDALTDGTPRELLPIAEEVLAWVARERRHVSSMFDGDDIGYRAQMDHIRRIELCALATREAAMLFDLYGGRAPSGHIDHIGGDPHGETASSQGQRSEAEGIPGAPGCR